jgi:hypothetical protein
LYASRSYKEKTNDPNASASFFSTFANMFASASAATEAERPDADDQFANVFEEAILSLFYFPEPQLIWLQLLRPEVERFAPWWAYVGAVCGGGIGFIVANVPGLMLGAYAGNRLGAIRDAKGKSVAAVFTQLGGNQKAEASQTSRRVFRLLILKSHPTRFCARWL